MRTMYFALLSGGALLAATSFANAQGTGITANPDQGVTAKQCWDVSRNIIREKNATETSAPSTDKTPKTTVGATASGATASGSTNSAGNASARPAGMPDC
jgi:cytoskeletal protein RodZ